MRKFKITYFILLIIPFVMMINSFSLNAQNRNLKIALLKYNGGGDWYANPTSLPNLIEFCNREQKMNLYRDYETVEPGSPDIFNYPFIHMTGHGNVVFSDYEMENLRKYLLSGGFLHIDDNYGMDEYIRPILKNLFSGKELTEIGFEHKIFHQIYDFPKGLPKIHKHDDKAPRGFGYFHEGRLILLYTYETDLGDGWEDPAVHNDSRDVRQKALKMGANIVSYVFMN